MTDLRLAPYAAATLRLSLGVMFLAHSVVLKLLTFGLPGNQLISSFRSAFQHGSGT